MYRRNFFPWLVTFLVCFLPISIETCGATTSSPPPQPIAIAADLKDGRVLLRLSPTALNKDFLIVRDRVGQTLVRWMRVEDAIQLVAPPIETTIGPDIHSSAYLGGHLSKSARPSILASFPIMDTTNEGSLEFDATNLFLNSVGGIPTVEGTIDHDRSAIEKVRSFQNLVEIRATHTLTPSSLRKQVLNQYQLGRQHGEPLTIGAFWSILQLPEKLMRPRLHDPRMGFFPDTADLNVAAAYSTGILKWRLEQRDPSQPISEVREPIVFYLGTETPGWMKPSLKAGIESWNLAFEAAGFENAVIVRNVPASDTDFDERSLRYSVVRIANKMGVRRYSTPRDQARGGGSVYKVSDPRTGEILKADILISVPNEISQNRYFVSCGALDPRARQIPFPKSLQGDLYKVTAAHEAGHAFGIIDGNYGEFVYPTEKLRDQTWLETMGFSPSVMNYSRCNYAAQPEDNIPVEYLLPRVGPADIHQIRWGYTPVADANTMREERSFLETIVREVDSSPWYSYVCGVYGISPQIFNNAIDAADPITSTRLGLKNLRRALSVLPTATLHEEGGNFQLEQMYFVAINHWVTLMRHVASMAGGYTVHPKNGIESGPVYSPLPAVRQREAMAYLSDAAFATPLYLADTSITRRFESSGTIDNVVKPQIQVLDDLFRADRLSNLMEFELATESGVDSYGLTEYLGDIRRAIWTELADKLVRIGPYRQQLQRAHVDRLQKAVGQSAGSVGIQSNLRNEFRLLHDEIERGIYKSKDHSTRIYLEYVLERLSQMPMHKVE